MSDDNPAIVDNYPKVRRHLRNDDVSILTRKKNSEKHNEYEIPERGVRPRNI